MPCFAGMHFKTVSYIARTIFRDDLWSSASNGEYGWELLHQETFVVQSVLQQVARNHKDCNKMQAQLKICNTQVLTPFAFIGGEKFLLGLCLFWWSFIMPGLYSVIAQRRKWNVDCCNSRNSGKWRPHIWKEEMEQINSLPIDIHRERFSFGILSSEAKSLNCRVRQKVRQQCLYRVAQFKSISFFCLMCRVGALTYLYLLLFLCVVSKSHSSTYLSLVDDCY